MFGLFKDSTPDVHCSFCGLLHTEVRTLVSGPDVYICDSCISECNNVVKRELGIPAKLIELEGGTYNLDHFVAISEIERPQTPSDQWDNKPLERELLVQFSGGVCVRLPLSEHERLTKLIQAWHKV